MTRWPVERWVRIAALYVAVFGVFSYAVRLAGSSALVALGTYPIRANASLCFACAGVALWLNCEPQWQPWQRRLSRGLALTVLAVASLTLFEYAFDFNLGIDELLIKPAPLPGELHPERLPLATTILFLAISVGLLVHRQNQVRPLGQAAAMFAATLSTIVVVGYALAVGGKSGLVSYFGVAFLAAASALVLSLAILATERSGGLFADFDGVPPKGVGLLVLVALPLLSIATAWGWSTSRDAVLAANASDLEARAAHLAALIRERMSRHEAVLIGAKGYLAVERNNTRKGWREYVELLRVDSMLPGIQGVGYALRIKARDLADHIRDVRAEGFADYTVWPEGQREVYSSIIYLEPFRDRNLRALGYDMLTEPVRHAALEQATDSGQVSLSGKVTLVQETRPEVQPGFLMYVPTYRPDWPRETVAQRRLASTGFVYSPFRAQDFFRSIFDGQDTDVGLEIFDGENADDAMLLIRRGEAEAAQRTAGTEQRIVVAGHAWTLRAYPTAGSHAEKFRNLAPTFVGVFGTAFSLLLVGLGLA